MKRILINAQQSDELRVALLQDDQLFDLNIETVSQNRKRSNIYKGIITRIEPSLEAAFVDFGQDRHGFLPFKEVCARYINQPNDSDKRPNISESLKSGQEIIVQVEKEERGSKGASLTTYISLAGSLLVLMPTSSANEGKVSGISRSLDNEQRKEMREALESLTVPDGMRLIIRTSGVGHSVDELQWNLDYLLKLWNVITDTANEKSAPFLIHQEDGLIQRTIRDYLRTDVEEILIDDTDTYQNALDFVNRVIPSFSNKIKLYNKSLSLFNHFDIETQIENAFSRVVALPSGGAIVIDSTEALCAIDVNSSRATQGKDIEETALQTNLEAAEEVARQLRLRDLGGLMVIDFIDMSNDGNRKKVESRLYEWIQYDRARVKISNISRFGLLEMSRQRLGSSLIEDNQSNCPYCAGTGITRSIESISLAIIRALEDAAIAKGAMRLYLQLPVDVATFMINEKRSEIMRIEERHRISVVVIPNEYLVSPNFTLETVQIGDKRLGKYGASYTNKKGTKPSTADVLEMMSKPQAVAEKPAVNSVSPDSPVPTAKKPGFFARLFGLGEQKPEKPVRRGRGKNSNNRRHYSNRRGVRNPVRRQNNRSRNNNQARGNNSSNRPNPQKKD